LVIDEVRRGSRQGKIPLTLANDLMTGSEWNEVGEPGAEYRFTIVDIFRDRFS